MAHQRGTERFDPVLSQGSAAVTARMKKPAKAGLFRF
jgi:hypothetical protein